MQVRELLRLGPGKLTGDDPIVGAAIGVGMTAEAAERGGADFLLALNAGRYRVMGAASLAAMLPLDDANRWTDAFARREILDRVSVPVFFGATVFDPRLEIDRLVADIADAGYRGIANFPTSIHFDGRFRRALEEAGLGFARESEMLAAARRVGLATFGYAKTRTEIDLLMAAEADIICLNFGWNAGGVRGVAQTLSLDEAADRARRVFQQVRQARPDAICVVEGGPIISPEDMYRVCRDGRADGYVGGSTLDRVPLELRVMQVTSAFKTVSVLRESAVEQDKEIARAARMAGIFGQSDAIQRVLEQMVRLGRTNLPVLILGEPGCGRTSIARAMHAVSRRQGSVITFNARESGADHEEYLFGSESALGRGRRRGALETPHATLIVESLDHLSPGAQVRLVDWLERGGAERVGGARLRQAEAGFVGIAPAGSDGLRHDLLQRLRPGRIEVPPLRDRPEDIPLYARTVLESIRAARQSAKLEITPDGYRTLFAHRWPENLRELRTVVEQAALSCDGPQIGSAELATVITRQTAASEPDRPLREREWILDGLRRNRFRRGDTAAFLNISRKTLYNKMKHYGLLD